MLNELIIALLLVVPLALIAIFWRWRSRQVFLPNLPGLASSFESPGVFVLRVDCALLSQSQLDDLGARLEKMAPKHLDLTLEHANNASWIPFAQISTIERLCLPGAKISISSFRELAQPDVLEMVHLQGSSATDEMIAWLGSRARSMEELVLADTQITDQAVAALVHMPNLWFLDLSGTGITDAGLQILPRANKLHTLILSNTCVSDAGVLLLVESLELAEVTLAQTGVTVDGTRQLKQAVAATGRKIEIWL